MSYAKLIYIDPGFLNDVGHYRNYARSVHDEARRRGVSVLHYVNTGVSDRNVREFGLTPLFPHRASLESRYLHLADRVLAEARRGGGGRRPGKGPLLTLRFLVARGFRVRGLLTDYRLFRDEVEKLLSFQEAMTAVLDRVPAGEEAVMYMYTGHPAHAAVLASLLGCAAYRKLALRCYLAVFYLDNDFCQKKRAPGYPQLLEWVAASLEGSDPQHRVVLCSDSQRTIDRYAPFLRRSMELLPIPLGREEASREAASPAEGGEIVVGYFGYAHRRQGFHLLKGLREAIVQQYRHVHFLFKHNFCYSDAAMVAESGRLSQVQDGTVTHIHGDLAPEEHFRRIESCDIVLIPHAVEEYPCQTSGTFIDALKLGKVLVVPQDTWMADMLALHGSGISFRSGDLASLIAALSTVLDDFERYRRGTGRNLEAFSAFHLAGTLLDKIGLGGSDPAVP